MNNLSKEVTKLHDFLQEALQLIKSTELKISFIHEHGFEMDEYKVLLESTELSTKGYYVSESLWTKLVLVRPQISSAIHQIDKDAELNVYEDKRHNPDRGYYLHTKIYWANVKKPMHNTNNQKTTSKTNTNSTSRKSKRSR